MTTQEISRQIGRIFVQEAQSDAVGFWLLAKWVKEDLPSLDATATRKATLDIVRDALLEKGVVPGEFVDHDEDSATFVPWELSVDETIARLDRDWSALGRELNPGEVAWFVAPGLLPVTARKHPMGKGWKPKSV